MTYLISIDKTLALRSGIVYKTDIIFGLFFIIALLEATRRVVGNSLTIVVLCFVAYAFLGQYLPSFLRFAGMSIKRFVEVMYLGSDGIFGVALYSSAAFIVLFIILGAIFQLLYRSRDTWLWQILWWPGEGCCGSEWLLRLHQW